MRKRKYVSLDDSTNNNNNTEEENAGSKCRKCSGWGFNDTNLHLMHRYTNQNYDDDDNDKGEEDEGPPEAARPAAAPFPVPQCHNIVSTSQIVTSQASINLQRLADLYPFTTYDRKRFAAITIRLANPHCTCLLFGSGKLVITGSTSFRWLLLNSHHHVS